MQLPPAISDAALEEVWNLTQLASNLPGDVGEFAGPGDLVMGQAACRDPASGRLLPRSAWADATILLVGDERLSKQLTTTTPLQTIRCVADVPDGWPHVGLIGTELEIQFHLQGWRTPVAVPDAERTRLREAWESESESAYTALVREQLYDRLVEAMDVDPSPDAVTEALRPHWERAEGAVFRRFEATDAELASSWAAWSDDAPLRTAFRRRVAHEQLLAAHPELATVPVARDGDVLRVEWR